MNFKKYICPVCNNCFTDDDDVVVCPDCGTPHHRECWKKTGKCVNENLHGTGEPVELLENKDFSSAPKIVESVSEKKDDDPFGRKDIPDIIKTASVQSALIDGKPSVYYEIAVGKNQKYYIPRFMLMNQLKKGISWNFMAFLLPLSWSLYRKMYKFAALILAAYMLLFGISAYYISTNEEFTNAVDACMQEDPEFIYDVTEYLSGGGNVSLSRAEQEFIEAMNNIQMPQFAALFLTILPFAIKVLLGLFANKEYMKKLRKSIDNAEKKGLLGDDLKKHIYKKNGTLPIALVAIVGFFEFFTMRF